ncbi:MAG: DUF1844 domain-containing protein [Acidobacteria bacterium]|nr:DUF1844 domain-containing protein [Acidobacteriota bacterium]
MTDKRLFTEEGDLRDPASAREPSPTVESPKQPEPAKTSGGRPDASESRAAAEPGDPEPPNTLFTSFLDSLIVNAYMALGLVRHPYRDDTEIDVQGARQMIDVIEMLTVKTKGNLTTEESEYLKTHLGELKLAFVRRSKSI